MDFLVLPYSAKESLFKQMVFNVAASNRDDHTKNFSFTMDRNGNWDFSPAYDLTFPFDPYQSFYVPHKISINGQTKNIGRKDLVAAAILVGIRGYEKLIDTVLEVVSGFRDRISAYPVSNKTVDLIQGEIFGNCSRLKR